MTRTPRRLPLLLAVALIAAATAAPARSAPLSGVLATGVSDGPIAASGSTVAWNQWDDAAGGYRVVADQAGAVRALDVAPSPLPFGLAAGRGPAGATWLVWSRCSGQASSGAVSECDIEGYNMNTQRPLSFPFAARRGVVETAPAIDRDRLLYVAGAASGVSRVHLAALVGARRDRVVDVLPATTCALSEWQECLPVTRALAQSSALRGDHVAVTSRVSTSGVDAGICGLATVRLLDLRTRAVRTLDDALCGLSGQSFADATFDDAGLLHWRLACGGDTSACQGTSAGPFRQTSGGPQRVVQGSGSSVAGSAMAGSTPILLTRAPRTTPNCWTGPGTLVYRCATITAIAKPSYASVRPPRETLPPPGYVTVTGTSRVRLLRPPARMACSRGDARPKPGATLWIGASWLNGKRHTHGPAVPVTATAGGRTVKGKVPKGATNFEGQLAATVGLGTPAKACGRTWTVTYRPPNAKPIAFTTRVLAG